MKIVICGGALKIFNKHFKVTASVVSCPLSLSLLIRDNLNYLKRKVIVRQFASKFKTSLLVKYTTILNIKLIYEFWKRKHYIKFMKFCEIRKCLKIEPILPHSLTLKYLFLLMVKKHKFAIFSKCLQVILVLLMHFALVKLNILFIYPMKNGLAVNETIKTVHFLLSNWKMLLRSIKISLWSLTICLMFSRINHHTVLRDPLDTLTHIWEFPNQPTEELTEGKKRYFFGNFFVHIKWMISSKNVCH